MELTHVYVTHPIWLKLAVVGTFIFPFVVVLMNRRIKNPMALLMFLIAGNLVATWTGLFSLARGMSLAGGGHRAASAGGAEAQMPLFIGPVVAALTAGVFAARLRSEQNWASATLYLTAVLIIGIVLEVWFTWFVTRQGRSFAPRQETIAQTGAMLSLALLAGFLILTFRQLAEPRSGPSASSVFTVIAISSGVMAVALWRFARSLAAVALGQ